MWRKTGSVPSASVPLSVTDGNRSIIALPYNGFKITCTSADDRGIHTQHLSIDINPDTYISEIAPARTFTVYEDIEPLLAYRNIESLYLKGNDLNTVSRWTQRAGCSAVVIGTFPPGWDPPPCIGRRA